jgi:hypothetical protein
MRVPPSLGRFAPALAVAAVAAVTLLPAWLLSGSLAERMLRQEARRTSEFVNNILLVEKAEDFLRGGQPPGPQAAETFAHLIRLPSVLRANMYSHERTILWSTQASLIGQPMRDDAELDQALRGKLVAYGGKRRKPEHRYLRTRDYEFIEIYSPIRSETTGEVLGVVELYTMPGPLFDDIRASQRAIWAAALLSALVLGAFIPHAVAALTRDRALPR